MSADELKAQGNAAFSSKDYTKAVDLFSQAITASAEPNAVLYSNRSGAYAALKQWKNALSDAEEAVRIKPDWVKAYTRKAAALHGEGDLVQALDVYEAALKIDPSNAQAKSGLDSVNAAIQREAAADGQTPDLGIGKLFNESDAINKLFANDKTRPYLSDPAFLAKFSELAKNPMQALSGAVSDPRLMEAVSVVLGIDLTAASKGNEDAYAAKAAKGSDNDTEMKDAPAPKPKATASSKNSKPEPAPEPASPEKAAADEEKAKGNAAYKAHNFDEAIAHYNAAWEAHKDITYLNNRAAAEFEKGAYETAIATCKLAISEAQELHSNYTLVAKAYGRIGSSYLKLEDLPNAIAAFEKSLTEHRSPDILTKLRNTQKELRVREETAYLNPQKADEARERGNELFKAGDFPGSVKEYTESIKRAPKDPRGYGNRAAAFLKLMNYPDVIRDCDEAIKLDPKFFKAYTRKATALNVMKQYRKSMDTLDEARALDTEHKHSREIEDLYNKALSNRFSTLPGETDEQRAERLAADPEVDEIRRDPVMNSILQQAASSTAAMQDHMKNPEVRRKVNLLAAAGLIRTR